MKDKNNLFTKVSISCSILSSLKGNFLSYLDEAEKYFNEIGNYSFFVNYLYKNNKERKEFDNDSIASLIVWAKKLLNFKVNKIENGDNDKRENLIIIDDENYELYLQIVNEIDNSLNYICNVINKSNIKVNKKIG